MTELYGVIEFTYTIVDLRVQKCQIKYWLQSDDACNEYKSD